MSEARLCPRCGAQVSASARYCDQCGQPLTSAGAPTERLGSLPSPWFQAEGYRVRVHAIKDGTIHDTGVHPPRDVRSVRLNVEYLNESAHALRHRPSQWLLYDREGYSYEFELRVQFFGDDAPRRLQDGLIGPGSRARGWVAFAPPPQAAVAYAQFRADHRSERAAEIPLAQP